MKRHLKSPPIHFKQQREGALAGSGPVRMSTAARMLREKGAEKAATELEAEAKIAAPWCQKCERKIEDPVIGILGDRVAFVCPWCSAPEVLAKWEAERRPQ